MNKKAMAIAISVVLLVLTVAGVLFGIYWEPIQNAINGTVTYTYEDVQNAYNQGYDEGVSNEASLLKQIEDFKNQVEQLQIDLDYYKELAEANPELEEQIKQLQLQVEQLNATIRYYEELLKNEGDQNLVFANFYYENTLIKSVAIKAGDLVLESEIPYSYGEITIEGWKYNDETVDFSTFHVNEDVNLYAVITAYNVTFIVDDATYGTPQTVIVNQYPVFPEAPTKDGYDFIGWSNGQETITEPQPIIEDTTYTAVFQEYAVFDTNWKAQLQSMDDSLFLLEYSGTYIVSLSFLREPIWYENLYLLGTLESGIQVYTRKLYDEAEDREIQFVFDGNIYAPENCSELFKWLNIIPGVGFEGYYIESEFVTINFENFNTKFTTDMSYMFQQTQSIASLDLSTFDTSNVTNMDGMFNGCVVLDYLNISNFDTSKVTDCDNMFLDCDSLSRLDIKIGSGYTLDNLPA